MDDRALIRFSTAASVVLAVVVAGSTVAATGPIRHPELRPVDQAVEDIDPLAVGMRVPSVGLREDGEQTSLYRLDDTRDGRPVYYRLGPGFRARVTGMDYLVPTARHRGRYQYDYNITPRRDGWFLEMPRIDTVYELSPIGLDAQAPAASRPAHGAASAVPPGVSNSSMGVPPSMITHHRVVHPGRAAGMADQQAEGAEEAANAGEAGGRATARPAPRMIHVVADDRTLAIREMRLPSLPVDPHQGLDENLMVPLAGPIEVPIDYRVDGDVDLWMD